MRLSINRIVFTLAAFLIIAGSALMTTTSSAQSGFATNTPAADAAEETPATPEAPSQPVIFATNTPDAPADAQSPVIPARDIRTPEASLFNYALRQWFESDLLDRIYEQIDTLNAGDTQAARALQISLYELERRFAGAPRTLAARQTLIEAMFDAPAGTVDMRSIVRPYIEAKLNDRNGETQFEVDGFFIAVQPALLDSTPPLDAVVRVVYPAEAAGSDIQPLYEDIILATTGTAGTMSVLPVDYDLPAVPFGNVERMSLLRVQDVNRDGLDEAVIIVDDGMVNERMLILGVRAGTASNLVQPGQDIRLGQQLEWDVDNEDNPSPELRILHYREESTPPDFPCLSQIPVTWAYSNNYYRPSTADNDRYELQDSLGCTLHDAEPFFTREPAEGIQEISDALNQYSITAPGAERALMTLAMLYTLDGQIDMARQTAQSVLPAGDPSQSWAGQQSTALLDALSVQANTALDVCEALVIASDEPACEVDEVLERFFTLITLNADEELIPQLENYGFPIEMTAPVSQVGRADRTVVLFDIEDSGWWGFARTRTGEYVAERAESPLPEPVTTVNTPVIAAPPNAYTELVINDDPRSALALIETTERNNPGAPLAPDARYLIALSNDLIGNRDAARQGYYNLWSAAPETIWGQLAADHLELR